MIELLSFSASSSISVEDKENKAVSDPDIRAEQPNKNINIRALRSKSKVNGVNNCIDDSVSKIIMFSYTIRTFFCPFTLEGDTTTTYRGLCVCSYSTWFLQVPFLGG